MTEYRKAQIICELLSSGTMNEQIKSEYTRLLNTGYIKQVDNRLYAINKH